MSSGTVRDAPVANHHHAAAAALRGVNSCWSRTQRTELASPACPSACRQGEARLHRVRRCGRHLSCLQRAHRRHAVCVRGERVVLAQAADVARLLRRDGGGLHDRVHAVRPQQQRHWLGPAVVARCVAAQPGRAQVAAAGAFDHRAARPGCHSCAVQVCSASGRLTPKTPTAGTSGSCQCSSS